MKTPEEVAAEMVGADGWVDNAVRLLEPAAYPGVRGIIAALITHSRAEGATAERERLAAHAEQPAEEVAGEMVSADGWIDNTVRLLEPVSHSELRGILTRLIARERAASVALIADLNSALAEAESAADAEAIRLVAEVTRWRAVSGCETPEAFLGSTAGDRWDDTGPDPEPFV